jgi:hypothetical protein
MRKTEHAPAEGTSLGRNARGGARAIRYIAARRAPAVPPEEFVAHDR